MNRIWSCYIEKKAKFHKKLIDGDAHEFKVESSRHVSILGFHGADNVAVVVPFRTACSAHVIRGVSVYMPSDVIDQLDQQLQLNDYHLMLTAANATIKSFIIGRTVSIDDDDHSSVLTA